MTTPAARVKFYDTVFDCLGELMHKGYRVITWQQLQISLSLLTINRPSPLIWELRNTTDWSNVILERTYPVFIGVRNEYTHLNPETILQLLQPACPLTYSDIFPVTNYLLALERIFQNDDLKYVVREFLGINNHL